jgi:rare lipoprotein A
MEGFMLRALCAAFIGVLALGSLADSSTASAMSRRQAFANEKALLSHVPARPVLRSRYGTAVRAGKAEPRPDEPPVVVTSRLSATALPTSAQVGLASFYRMGVRTASGERFNPKGLTAAHRTLPFGTKVLVTNVASGRSVVVRINDRGPFAHGRIIDLAQGAAEAIGLSGTGKVALKVLN